MRRFAGATRAFAAVLLVAAVGASAACGDDVRRPPAAERVLVVSLPGVGWHDVIAGRLPELARFARSSAVGNLSTRVGRESADPASAYLTISAGTRSLAPEIDAELAVDTTDDRLLVDRRLGPGVEGVAYLMADAAADRNDRAAYRAQTGMLGETLAKHGVHRAVLANADTVDLGGEPQRRRSAAAALAGPDGRVPAGSVSAQLLVDAPEAPFGLRLDIDAVLDEFRLAWQGDGRRLVLVEASDLRRADDYREVADGGQRGRQRRAALGWADDLLGRLLLEVDPAHDAVLVIAPIAPGDGSALGVAALRAPNWSGGMLRSATTRRDGYVQLADITPTLLELLHLEAPGRIEGRRFVAVGTASADRVERLADEATAAVARDDLVPGVTTGLIAFLVVLVAATLLRGRVPRLRRLAPWGAYAGLGSVVGTFVAPQVGSSARGLAAHVTVSFLVGALVAVVAVVADRGRPGLGAVVSVGLVVTFLSADVLAGSALQLNAVYGYSVAVAGRFAGVGNLAFALLGSSAIVLAGLLAGRYGRPGTRVAVAGLLAVVFVDGLPFFGGDVGGLVSMVPAFGVTALVLAGRRIGWHQVGGLIAVTVATVLGFAALDLNRPTSSQTHLARAVSHLVRGRWDDLSASLGRRFTASFGGMETFGWLLVAALSIGVVAYVGWQWPGGRWRGRRSPRLDDPARDVDVDVDDQPLDRPSAAVLAGLAVLAVAGLVANDSSIAVPTTMLLIVTPAIVLRATGHLVTS